MTIRVSPLKMITKYNMRKLNHPNFRSIDDLDVIPITGIIANSCPNTKTFQKKKKNEKKSKKFASTFITVFQNYLALKQCVMMYSSNLSFFSHHSKNEDTFALFNLRNK